MTGEGSVSCTGPVGTRGGGDGGLGTGRVARDNQLKGLQAGQPASLPLRWVAVGDAVGPWRHPSARHQFLLTPNRIWLV